MANKKFIAMMGGIAGIAAVLTSLFLDEMAWYEIDAGYDMYAVLNGLGGGRIESNGNLVFSSYISLGIDIIPGILVFVGGIMTFTGERKKSVIGSSLMLVGVLAYIAIIYLVFVSQFQTMGLDTSNINIFHDNIAGMELGFDLGLFIAGGASVFALVGSLAMEKDDYRPYSNQYSSY